ncbi:MAG: hypothetical protein JNL32_08745 [Candidatus Kapabacteria bacterium]|nr:hypothetical protein [Candidatus Kapabacteria bacterium]
MTTTLRGVWACSPLNVYAVGDRGVLLRTRNGGTTWERMTNPVGGGEFRDVRMYRDSAGVAVGRIQTEDGVRGLILHTSDGGTTWRNYVPPAGMTLPLLNCLAANQDPTLFSSVGNKSMGMYASGMRANGATSNIISSPDYGATWNLWSNGISGEISSIGLSSNIIFFGSGNEIWERDDINSSSNNQKLLQSKLYPNSVTNSIRAAHGNIASYHGPTIVGENGLIMETFIGIGWYSIPTTINHDFNGIHSIVIGNTIGTFYRLAVGNRGTIVKITKSQERWRP